MILRSGKKIKVILLLSSAMVSVMYLKGEFFMIRQESWLYQPIKVDSIPLKAFSIMVACLSLAFLAQVKIPLPFSPVPITGQTFGVALMALLYGRRLALLSVATYLLIGGLGAPVFTNFQSGLVLGPTMGYLFGMMFSASLIGYLADKGYAKTWKTAFLSCVAGSCITFTFGLSVLSFFVPLDSLFLVGLLPFIPGDIIKNALAASIAQIFYKKL